MPGNTHCKGIAFIPLTPAISAEIPEIEGASILYKKKLVTEVVIKKFSQSQGGLSLENLRDVIDSFQGKGILKWAFLFTSNPKSDNSVFFGQYVSDLFEKDPSLDSLSIFLLGRGEHLLREQKAIEKAAIAWNRKHYGQKRVFIFVGADLFRFEVG
jgi:hypothetical protein